MLKRFLFLLIVALTTAPAHATFYVWVDGQAEGITGGANYSHYIQDENTTVGDDKVLHSPNLSNAAFGSSSSIGTLKGYLFTDARVINQNRGEAPVSKDAGIMKGWRFFT